MKSVNFEFLRPKWPELASLGGFAESYAHSDPVSSLTKLRTFCEQLALVIRFDLSLPKMIRPTLVDLLDDASFRAVVPSVVVTKMHAIRSEGNRAVHGNSATSTVALRLLKEGFDIARWLFVSLGKGSTGEIPDYEEPPAGGIEAAEQRREKRAILERVAAQETQLQQILSERETAREQAKNAEATPAEIQSAHVLALQTLEKLAAVDPLSYDEAATRQFLIDTMLADVGWKVGPGETSTDDVGKEIEVLHQTTPTGIGYADYVLYDDAGKPLGVIEAKRTAADPEIGRKQAEMYADGLQKMHGVRPIIFYTNGYDLWIWNDSANEPPRKIYGFYSKDSLQHAHFQRREKEPLSNVTPNPKIAGRMYQMEAVRRVVEKFATGARKALIVQATGTGKTRVAISLCDAMIRAKWAKRILFLCDRRELRKQAHNAFKEYLPGEPRVNVTAATALDRNQRIYLATYPAMMKCFETFDVGFFDLVIADESHRSLYNRYRAIFQHFDACQIGLTATPVEFITRNTFGMFGCNDQDPTANYSYQDAISHDPPYLSRFEVESHTTPFLRRGIRYREMTEEQRQQVDDQEEVPESIDYDKAEVDKYIFNKDTNRHILRNLMEHGLKVADDTRLGKTIIFARSHEHAVLIQNLFDEMYPQFGGKFCRVIDNYDPRAEDLIDDLKGQGTNPDLTIAVSVDMLDTGIDIPEVVNLVFAKPVFSHVKFWQMIGRGTRLCADLFGLGRHKTVFKIFDHWGNFEWFQEHYKPAEPTTSKPLLQSLFEARLNLADVAIEKQNSDAFDLCVELLVKDIADLPDKSIPVREAWKDVKFAGREESIRQFDAATRATLRQTIAPLMQWRNIAGHEAPHKFDRLIARLQVELLRGSTTFDNLKGELIDAVSALPVNLSQVKVKLPVIERVKSNEFWDHVSVRDLEEIRIELRGIIQYRPRIVSPGRPTKVIDVAEDPSLIERRRIKVKLAPVEMAAYRERVQRVLLDIFDQNETLQKIKAGQPVAESDLSALCSLVLTLDPSLDLRDLIDYYPDFAPNLDQAIRGIIGLDARAVHSRFEAFVQEHPNLASHQIRFLDVLQNHISKYGSIDVDRLYEPPFTQFHQDGLDGLFEEPLAGELVSIVRSFAPAQKEAIDND